MLVLCLNLVMKGALLLFMLARRILPQIVWPHEVRWAVLAVFAERDYPECHVPERLLPHVSHRRKWNAIKYCARQGWLDWDMMVRITPAGRERLARFRGEPYARLPQARLITARSHP
ncbi:MAG TPA: hypothetical protein VL283_00755 [Candidatus Baltobacteraceae bacterium]|nr:hypothetical protein [Candidatus Baltobacteraceae bacterium]